VKTLSANIVVQGFHFSRPLPPDAFAAYVARGVENEAPV
jgi:EAL domain-containing protein (putative c-di-GMP-specific phosphodiesterase class I)